MVYQIITFALIDKTFHTYKEMPELEEINDGNVSKFIYKGTKKEYPKSHLWKLTSNLTGYKNLINADERFIPYTAKLIEDLPGYLRFKPRVYEECKLLTQKHGGYLQFYHEPTNKVLRIAMNSYYYEPK